MKKATGALATLLWTSALFGGGLSTVYKNWDRTPEAYFMTRAEREQWKTIKADDAAQKFIADYKARRGAEWEKTLAERVAAADKYFSSGKTKGSETLRGKVVIVFGPPSAVSQGKKAAGPHQADMGLGIRSSSKGGSDDGLAISSGGASPIGTAPRHVESPTVTFGYDASSAPPAIGRAFEVELRMISNADQEAVDPKGLEEKIEAVAQASQTPKASPPGSSEPVDGY